MTLCFGQLVNQKEEFKIVSMVLIKYKKIKLALGKVLYVKLIKKLV